jgi:hypothetical protein
VKAARRPLVLRVLAGLLCAAGLLLLVAGLLRATVLAPSPTTVGRVSGVQGAPLVATAAGALDLDGSTVRIEVRAGADRPVFLGIGRADDVEAYLGGAARSELVGIEDGRAAVRQRQGEPAAPDPRGVDVWAAGAQGRGTVALTWPDAPGRWRAVATTDGSRPPEQVTFTWDRAERPSGARPLLVAAALLLLTGSAGIMALRPGTALSRRVTPAPRVRRVAGVPR